MSQNTSRVIEGEKASPSSNKTETVENAEIVDDENTTSYQQKLDPLEKLIQRKEQGYLNEEEFQAAKRKLLGL
jgi:hypothetical protein